MRFWSNPPNEERITNRPHRGPLYRWSTTVSSKSHTRISSLAIWRKRCRSFEASTMDMIWPFSWIFNLASPVSVSVYVGVCVDSFVWFFQLILEHKTYDTRESLSRTMRCKSFLHHCSQLNHVPVLFSCYVFNFLSRKNIRESYSTYSITNPLRTNITTLEIPQQNELVHTTRHEFRAAR